MACPIILIILKSLPKPLFMQKIFVKMTTIYMFLLTTKK